MPAKSFRRTVLTTNGSVVERFCLESESAGGNCIWKWDSVITIACKYLNRSFYRSVRRRKSTEYCGTNSLLQLLVAQYIENISYARSDSQPAGSPDCWIARKKELQQIITQEPNLVSSFILYLVGKDRRVCIGGLEQPYFRSDGHGISRDGHEMDRCPKSAKLTLNKTSTAVGLVEYRLEYGCPLILHTLPTTNRQVELRGASWSNHTNITWFKRAYVVMICFTFSENLPARQR